MDILIRLQKITTPVSRCLSLLCLLFLLEITEAEFGTKLLSAPSESYLPPVPNSPRINDNGEDILSPKNNDSNIAASRNMDIPLEETNLAKPANDNSVIEDGSQTLDVNNEIFQTEATVDSNSNQNGGPFSFGREDGISSESDIADRASNTNGVTNSGGSVKSDDGGSGTAKDPRDGDSDGIPGFAGGDYPTLARIPDTSFSCRDQEFPGYYADQEAQCQVFYICQVGGRQNGFLCPNGTLFNQRFLVCDWWYNVECEEATDLFSLNEGIYSGSETGSGRETPENSDISGNSISEETAASTMNIQIMAFENGALASDDTSNSGIATEINQLSLTKSSSDIENPVDRFGNGVDDIIEKDGIPNVSSLNNLESMAMVDDNGILKNKNERNGEDGYDYLLPIDTQSDTEIDNINNEYIPPNGDYTVPPKEKNPVSVQPKIDSTLRIDQNSMKLPMNVNKDQEPSLTENKKNDSEEETGYGYKIPEELFPLPSQKEVNLNTERTDIDKTTIQTRQVETTTIGYSFREPSNPLDLPISEPPVVKSNEDNLNPSEEEKGYSFPPPEKPLQFPVSPRDTEINLEQDQSDQSVKRNSDQGYSYPRPMNQVAISKMEVNEMAENKVNIVYNDKILEDGYLPPINHARVRSTEKGKVSNGIGYSYPTPNNPLMLPVDRTPQVLPPSRHYLPPKLA